MFNKKNKQPKLDPIQKRREEERQKEESRRGKLLKEGLYPLILADDKSIMDTKIFLQVLEMAVERAHTKTRSEVKVVDLKLGDALKNNPEAERYHKMLDVLNPETIEVSVDLLKSMGQIIENNLVDENRTRKLSELKLKYFDK